MPTIPTVFRSIDKGDYRTTSFKAYKLYIVSETGSGYNLYGARHQKYTPPIGAAIASNDPVNINGTNQYMVWNHIDHRYYRHPYDPARTHEHSNQRTVEKSLFMTASVFSIPYFEMGEKIKPGTLHVTDQAWSLYDDGNGNLRSSEIDSASFADKRKLSGYWTFNNEFRKFDTNYGTTNSPMKVLSHANTEIKSEMKSITTHPGVTLTGTVADSGIAGAFDGVNSYMKTPNHSDFNPGEGDNFAWSFWMRAGISQSNQDTTYNSLIRKQTDYTEDYWDPINKLVKTRTQYIDLDKYPYHISIKNNQSGVLTNGKIGFAVKGDNALSSCTSTTQCTGSYHHIVAQRSGSELQLWVDGTKEASSSIATGPTKNNRDIIFGAKQTNHDFAAFSGSMAEMRYYRYGLSTTQIASLANSHYLSGSLYQSSVAGNVFYRNGHVVISSPLPKFEGALTGSYTIRYNGVHTVYENEAFIEVPKDVCNISMNPSATYNPPDGNETSNDYLSSNGSGELIHPGFISGTMKPYITSIGLYNDKSQLLAVGKLSQAIQKRDDIDMNFVVRWDY
jgi:hypothetical protein|tara:strand:+ start:12963 stop:14645 length:1683 start_codon:yes stop_codon:yes gene_type:complete